MLNILDKSRHSLCGVCFLWFWWLRGGYRGGDGRWNQQQGGQGGRFDRNQGPPLPQNSRWDALADDRNKERRGPMGQGYNRWDNRQDCASDGKEDWSVPLPRNEHLEQSVQCFSHILVLLCTC
jgi:hypothetical protein